MKRIGNIFNDMISVDNIRLADKKARRGKRHQAGVIIFDKEKETNIALLHNMLLNKTYKTSPYTTFLLRGKKARLISRLPYFPDRIVHHLAMNKLEPVFNSLFTADTYSCIKNRGIHSALGSVTKALKDKSGNTYCLKLDIQKFYHSVDNDILKSLLRRKFKDRDLLWLLDEIIDSSKGLPIGNYLSQYFANFYLTPFDRWIKQNMRVVRYSRYMDDMIFFSDSKQFLHKLLADIKLFLLKELNLTVKKNYQIFEIAVRGLDFVGYVSFKDYILSRKSIKQGYIRMMIKNRNPASEASYMGWFKHCNSINLIIRSIPM